MPRPDRRLPCALVLVLVPSVLGGCRDGTRRPVAPPAAVAPPATRRGAPLDAELAEHHAPVIYQDIGARHGGLADLPLRIDFDGDWEGLNNWESLDAAAAGAAQGFVLGAHVYYSVVQTETHWFIHYFVYHPQDWAILRVTPWDEHEHDLEGMLVCIRKDPTGANPLGDLVLMETQAHGHFYQYSADPTVTAGEESLDGTVPSRTGTQGHPKVFQQAGGHGLFASRQGLSGAIYLGLRGTNFPGGDGLVFVPGGGLAQYALDPALGRDARDGGQDDARRRVAYALLPVEAELWPRRTPPASAIFATPWDYQGARHRMADLSRTFRGDTRMRDASVTPWAHDDRDDRVPAGDWFFDPAYTLGRHFRIGHPWSTRYLRNVYLGIP